MELAGDERAQSIQIGAVLLFAVLIIAFSSYQAFVIPQQNQEVEFNHNQQVQQQLQDLRNAIVSDNSRGVRSVTVELGTQYPSRLIGRNPNSPSGRLRTADTADESVDLTLSNARASGDVGDFWDGTPQRYNTGTLVYEPNYNLYTSAPTTRYANSILYNNFPSAQLPVSGQTIVQGREINLVALNGSLSRTASSSTSVDVEPVSRSSRTISITDDGNPVTVYLLTRLSAEEFRTVLGEELDTGGTDPSAYISGVSVAGTNGPYNNLSVQFEQGVYYELRLSKVGVGTQVRPEPDVYITVVDRGDSTVARGEETEIVLEVRDAYNNPVQNVTVEASDNSSSPGSFEATDNQRTTNEEGRVTFVYQTDASTATTPHQLNFTSDEAITRDDSVTPDQSGFQANGPKNVTRTVTVKSEGASMGNLPSGSLAFSTARAQDDGDGDGNIIPGGVEIEFQNTYSQEITITDIGLRPADNSIDAIADQASGTNPTDTEYYIQSSAGSTYVDFEEFESGFSSTPDGVGLPRETDLDIDGRENDGNAQVAAGGTATAYIYEFYRRSAGSSTNVDMGGKPLRVTMRYTVDNMVYEETYSVSPTGTSGRFSNVRATGMVPNGNQEQTLSFTPGSDLSDGTTVTINLDEPQQTSPVQVDYGSASIASVSSGSATWLQQANSGQTRIEYTAPSGGVTAGSTVSIRLSSVNAGDLSDQINPYTVDFTRDDTGESLSDDFSVARGSGSPGLNSLSVDSLRPNTGSQTQQISFSPASGTTLPDGETVYIDLSDAQGSDDVQYGSASVSVANGGGSVQFVEQTSDDVVLRYTSNGATDADTLTVELTSVSTGSGANSPYTVGLSRSDEDTASATFIGTNSPSAIQFSNFQGFTADADNDEFTIDQVQIQDNDGDDDLDRVEYVVTDSSGTEVASETVNNIGPSQYQPGSVTISASSVPAGDTYTVTATTYDTDGNFDSRSLSDTVNSYVINSVSPTDGGGNSIDVTVDITTTDGGADILVESLKNGNVQGSTTAAVSGTQPQTVSVGGGNQADEVRVTLRDSSDNVESQTTVPYN